MDQSLNIDGLIVLRFYVQPDTT